MLVVFGIFFIFVSLFSDMCIRVYLVVGLFLCICLVLIYLSIVDHLSDKLFDNLSLFV